MQQLAFVLSMAACVLRVMALESSDAVLSQYYHNRNCVGEPFTENLENQCRTLMGFEWSSNGEGTVGGVVPSVYMSICERGKTVVIEEDCVNGVVNAKNPDRQVYVQGMKYRVSSFSCSADGAKVSMSVSGNNKPDEFATNECVSVPLYGGSSRSYQCMRNVDVVSQFYVLNSTQAQSRCDRNSIVDNRAFSQLANECVNGMRYVCDANTNRQLQVPTPTDQFVVAIMATDSQCKNTISYLKGSTSSCASFPYLDGTTYGMRTIAKPQASAVLPVRTFYPYSSTCDDDTPYLRDFGSRAVSACVFALEVDSAKQLQYETEKISCQGSNQVVVRSYDKFSCSGPALATRTYAAGACVPIHDGFGGSARYSCDQVNDATFFHFAEYETVENCTADLAAANSQGSSALLTINNALNRPETRLYQSGVCRYVSPNVYETILTVSDTSSSSSLSNNTLLAIVVGGAALLLAIVVISCVCCVCYCRRRRIAQSSRLPAADDAYYVSDRSTDRH